MGETTGAFFSYAAEFTVDYHREHPRYQPFSVYEDYPGEKLRHAPVLRSPYWRKLAGLLRKPGVRRHHIHVRVCFK